jgi:hypothetical protein
MSRIDLLMRLCDTGKFTSRNEKAMENSYSTYNSMNFRKYLLRPTALVLFALAGGGGALAIDAGGGASVGGDGGGGGGCGGERGWAASSCVCICGGGESELGFSGWATRSRTPFR